MAEAIRTALACIESDAYGVDLGAFGPKCHACGSAARYAECTVTINRYVNGHPDPDITIDRWACETHRAQ